MGQPPPDAAQGVYGISVAAELVGLGPQTLRLYERRGLLQPARTSGGTRRYSQHNLDRLHRIAELLQAGLNLAGIALVLDLEHTNAQLRAHPNTHPNNQHPPREQGRSSPRGLHRSRVTRVGRVAMTSSSRVSSGLRGRAWLGRAVPGRSCVWCGTSAEFGCLTLYEPVH